MRTRRLNRGFQRLGVVDPGDAGIPARRARQLRLDRAWHAVVGDHVARRARAARLKAGILEIRFSDPRWARELARMVPTLVGRMAGAFPGLKIRKVRFVIDAEGGGPPSKPVAVEPIPPDETAGRSDRNSVTDTTENSVPRIEDLAKRYLSRLPPSR